MTDRIDLLSNILLDRSARVDERDDAAMDLGQYVDQRALDAVLIVATDPNEEPFIFDTCGEAIAAIWIRQNDFSYAEYKKLAPQAQQAVLSYIEKERPEWVKRYNL